MLNSSGVGARRGHDREQYRSAAFVSRVMKTAGLPGASLIGHRVADDAPRPRRQARGAAHSDIVVYAWSGEIGVIGGNSVSLERLPTA